AAAAVLVLGVVELLRRLRLLDGDGLRGRGLTGAGIERRRRLELLREDERGHEHHEGFSSFSFSVSSSSWTGTRYSSFNHLPRSTCRHRAEQNGPNLPAANCFLQIGHFFITR